MREAIGAMAESHGHHFLSQCYLKRFSFNGSKNSKFSVFDVQNGRWFETAPSNVAKKRDFNFIEGYPTDTLENALSGFETKADKALNIVESSRSINSTRDWTYVLNLITLFAIRNPRSRDGLIEFRDRVAILTMEMALETPKRWEDLIAEAKAAGAVRVDANVTYDDAKDFIDNRRFTLSHSNALNVGAEFNAFDHVLQLMGARKWWLYVAPQPSTGFVCSDHPVTLMHTNGDPPTLARPVGYGLIDTAVFVPLTRSLALYGTFEQEGHGQVIPLTERQVAAFNGLTLHLAQRQIYAADKRFSVQLEVGGAVIRGDEILGSKAYLDISERHRRATAI